MKLKRSIQLSRLSTKTEADSDNARLGVNKPTKINDNHPNLHKEKIRIIVMNETLPGYITIRRRVSANIKE